MLPDDRNLLRMWKNWEQGKHRPRPDYQRAIAATFGSVSAAIFGPDAADPRIQLPPSPLATNPETLEMVQRLRRSDLDAATFDTLNITVERLCSEYASLPSRDLHREAQGWMGYLVRLLDSRLTLAQHREVLVRAGWLALLLGCVEYDIGDMRSAEGSRRAAFKLGQEADHPAIMAWAYEMRSWFALTQGRYREVIEASRAGRAIAPRERVAVQLAAQEAKAWARMGDRHSVELALEDGRSLLESLPYPENIDNHFTVDPEKFDFYAMDCYRKAGDDTQAAMLAREVITKSTSPDGRLRSPMRIAEAHTTLAVVAAREGDLDAALAAGTSALAIPRQSLPSLAMISQDLVTEIHRRYDGEQAADDYLAKVRSLMLGVTGAA